MAALAFSEDIQQWPWAKALELSDNKKILPASQLWTLLNAFARGLHSQISKHFTSMKSKHRS